MGISLTDLERTLSPARLAPYRRGSRDDAEAICRYIWNMELSQAVYPALQSVEIGLRNSIHAAGAARFGAVDWFRDPAVLRLQRREQGMLDRATDQIWERQGYSPAAIRSGRVAAPPRPAVDDHVAELMFGFWTSLLNAPYQQTLWDTRPGGVNLTAAAFPHAGRRDRQRAAVFPLVNRQRHLRNRVSHHEPIWNWRPSLADAHRETLMVLGWVSPALLALTTLMDPFPAIYARGYGYYTSLLRLVP